MQLKGSALDCLLWRSTTDQTGRGMRVILHRLKGSPMCPVVAFQSYRELRRAGPGLLFVHKNGAFLSRFQFNQVFWKCLVRLGKDEGEYSVHSFCIG